MYRSKEIRWFFDTPQSAIEKWFDDRKMNFGNASSRQDYYLRIKDEGLTIKLREKGVETKKRTSDPISRLITPQAEAHLGRFGFFEYWNKWRFDLAESDQQASIIKGGTDLSWIRVDKARLGKKAVPGPDGRIMLLDIDDKVPYGCQIEYTRVTIAYAVFYSFGLEWFGDTSLDLSRVLLADILGAAKLSKEESMGYGAFLYRLSEGVM